MKSIFNYKPVVMCFAILALLLGQLTGRSAKADGYDNLFYSTTGLGVGVLAGAGVVTGGALSGNMLVVGLGGATIALAVIVPVGGAVISANTRFFYKEMILKQVREDAAQCLAKDCADSSAFLAPIMERVRAVTAAQYGNEFASSLTPEAIAEGLLNAEFR